ncbi:MAG: hypothetical protein HQL69_05575 [Magnetococcales bacterium]|nr:hypothetical protein [Magnetococcales bacterium]
MSFFAVDEEDASFTLISCNPKDKWSEIQKFGDQLIDSGEFAWALNQHRGLITQSKLWGQSVFLHQLATDQRIRGMFVGVIDLHDQDLSGSYLELFSIVFRNTAYALESAELYRMLDDHAKNLEERVLQRTSELNASNRDLEKANKFIRNTFGRYMSDEVVDTILDTPEGLQLGGERKEVTVLMSDLRGFTALSERLDSQELFTILNSYLEVMTEIILKYHGTIIEFLGDGILALFGAPVVRDDDVQSAVACALEMQLAMEQVNANNWDAGYPQLQMGIGINTGSVVAGNIGSEKRSKYGVVGAAINFAARIESTTVGGQILISHSTKQKCAARLQIEDTLQIKPKGIVDPVNVYQVVAIAEPYNIALSRPIATKFILAPPGLIVEIALLKGKNVGDFELEGSIIGVSKDAAEIQTNGKLEKYINLKLALNYAGKTITSELFAKVTGIQSGKIETYIITFTSTPASAAKLFNTIIKQQQF